MGASALLCARLLLLHTGWVARWVLHLDMMAYDGRCCAPSAQGASTNDMPDTMPSH